MRNFEACREAQANGLLRIPVNENPFEKRSGDQIALVGKIVEALRTAACKVEMVKHGIDIHEQAISTAKSTASRQLPKERAEFHIMDATEGLPFPDGSFDAITCIDAINHFPKRRSVVVEWSRLLKPHGKLLFTDPITVTGPLTNAEVSTRSSAGLY